MKPFDEEKVFELLKANGCNDRSHIGRIRRLTEQRSIWSRGDCLQIETKHNQNMSADEIVQSLGTVKLSRVNQIINQKLLIEKIAKQLMSD